MIPASAYRIPPDQLTRNPSEFRTQLTELSATTAPLRTETVFRASPDRHFLLLAFTFNAFFLGSLTGTNRYNRFELRYCTPAGQPIGDLITLRGVAGAALNTDRGGPAEAGPGLAAQFTYNLALPVMIPSQTDLQVISSVFVTDATLLQQHTIRCTVHGVAMAQGDLLR